MSNAIVVEHLSKRYLIGHRSGGAGKYKYTALRDVIGRGVKSVTRKATDAIHGRQVVQGDEIEEFWALKDISFEVKQGEVLGIIGRNGAGKSTLLKILSRITEPTAGRVLLRGRVSSLLEVGTGFHPELTGRENIFLNGAILGMTQREIRKKFDEIVAFSEVDKFLDTPVKYYSSGMYVRLAFAVAAHLEPEILIVDEVLAVGDSEFQKKCLGKMNEVSQKHGRTVLFVSHNMDAVLKLCSRGILLESGSVRSCGVGVKNDRAGPISIVNHLLRGRLTFQSKARPEGYNIAKARLDKVSPSDRERDWSFPFGHRISFDLSINAHSPPSPRSRDRRRITFGLGVSEVARSWTNKCDRVLLPARSGINTFRIAFQHLFLIPGKYFLQSCLRLRSGLRRLYSGGGPFRDHVKC